MRVALTGATGLVGFPLAMALRDAGHRVTALGRGAPEGMDRLPFTLGGPQPPLEGFDALVHAAFHHLPGRYRGGEGDDPEGFRSRNLDGTLALFAAAKAAGVRRILFLSSRAVHGGWPPGTPLAEDLRPRPDTLYGEVKLAAERGLAALAGSGLATASLRVTGIYGPPVPGRDHKWRDLFDAFDRGEKVAPRIGTEVHAGDVALAVLLLLAAPAEVLAAATFNVADIVLDRRDLLERWSRIAGIAGPLPPPGDPAAVSVPECTRLKALGWQPRGMAGLEPVLRALAGH